MQLTDLGFREELNQWLSENNYSDFELGRVIAEHKERYIVQTQQGELEAEITGNMRYGAQSREDFPAVGDWVALQVFDKNMAIIYHIAPRTSMISRKAVGQKGQIQIIATNIDYGLLVQATDRDFNINRLERYLSICYESKVEPVIVLTKIDLISEEELSQINQQLTARVKDVPVISLSNLSQQGYSQLENVFIKGKTYCLLGSSGVGKSSLVNNLSSQSHMKTDHISTSTNKGRHVTTHRELIVLNNGAIIIDNPGMREVGLANTEHGIQVAFDEIYEIGKNCRFKDCTHTMEAGCAVINAVEAGSVDPDTYDNYLKLYKENSFYESTTQERKRKDKQLGKILKHYKKHN